MHLIDWVFFALGVLILLVISSGNDIDGDDILP